MIYALTSQAVSDEIRKEIDDALKTLKEHEDTGTIIHVLEAERSFFCLYCNTRIKTWSKTTQAGKLLVYYQHEELPEGGCIGSDQHLGMENLGSHSVRVDKVWENWNQPEKKG